MQADVFRDLSRASRVFAEVVWPQISEIVGGGTLKPVEGSADKGMKEDLDMLAGIDGFQTIDRLGVMRGIAARVQYIRPGMPPYNTFTIRTDRPSGSKTEMEKRLYALKNRDLGFLYPHLTVQAYVDDVTEELLSVGIIRTVDLFTCVEYNPSGRSNRAGNGGQKFDIYAFDYLEQHGYKVHRWPQRQRIMHNGVEVTRENAAGIGPIVKHQQKIIAFPGGRGGG